ncbi:MAG: [FeFe] hydrogenase H-cluster maturation GTPase HydF [Lachnospiraceae bacterium]
MNMNTTPSSERTHIGIFGRRNAGKSSIINALTGQSLAIVSDIKGTTTDPVMKSMELLPLGPVVMIDTPGLDDQGSLGLLRVQKAFQILNKTDIALLVIDSTLGISNEDINIFTRIRSKQIPFLIVLNKTDQSDCLETMIGNLAHELQIEKSLIIPASAKTGMNINELKEKIASIAPEEGENRQIVSDLITPGDFVVLVVPIDKAAPKGRLILPQQQTIRDILDSGAVSIVTRDSELKNTLEKLGIRPSLVITDSQVFDRATEIVPADIPLTSFSILFARYKGNLVSVAKGAKAIDRLNNGDTVLISEGCTHHRQCEDIGTVKLPAWLRKYTGKELNFEFTSGTEFPLNLNNYSLIIHCGGCMLNEREMKYRLKCAEDAGIPITNYGTAIAFMKGILKRSISVFGMQNIL